MLTVDSILDKSKISVTAVKIGLSEFRTQTISNGKVFSSKEIPLSFNTPGVVESLSVENGATVTAGQLIASLQNQSHKLAVREAQIRLQESIVELNDQLISQGGRKGDSTSVPSEVYEYIKLRSGYSRATLDLARSKLELAKTFLYSPISGVIANVNIAVHGPVQTDKPICLLVGREKMIVRCSVMESELLSVNVGQAASVEAIGQSSSRYNAIVENINPVVSHEGLVEVVIWIKDPGTKLLSGMNVRVVIEKFLGRRIVVPKDAIVERNGQKVIFTLKNGRAQWNYVVLGERNEDGVVVKEGLDYTDEVIVSGNLNLAHDVEVDRIQSNAPGVGNVR